MKNIIKLYHYSKAYIPDKINPIYFGSNSYTRGDLKACSIARVFYYIKDDYIPEYYIKGWQYKYIVKINKSSIYDLRIDDLGLIDKFRGNIPDLLYYIKTKYKGVIYNLGDYDVAILFKAVKYNQIIRR